MAPVIKELISTLNSRYVDFDPSSLEHQRLFKTFIETNSWKHTDVRFNLKPPHTNIVQMMYEEMTIFALSSI